ncbi:SRPBCC family protein [Psychrobacillus vulpis]|uniref:SRPBCC family protein n=1 Tax=Psychrobacillus vulpis TaxID=2325572 RepID=A0A544TJD4_9BACI|nr:SRPBCC family protein [Psychrobacillus vulpis]TQR17536.1 SRPBCC family protein [Psychrobacillus vulpis]
MPIITHKQFINAPVGICFDLARNVDIHIKTNAKTKERAVIGVTEGLLEEGDIVTWEAIHLGIKQRLTVKVTYMEKPYKFVDTMLKGAFRSFTHLHLFEEKSGGTLMIDTFEYKSPFGLVGEIVDKLFLEKYMKRFIVSRANELKRIAENTE